MKKTTAITALMLLLAAFSACQATWLWGESAETQQTQQSQQTQETQIFTQNVDDWAFNPQANDEYGRAYPSMGGGISKMTGAPMMAMEAAPSGNLGYAVGGAKDINNFRENIENDYLPLPSDITYEGLFYGYYFDTGAKEECTKLFCPSYSTAVSKDPLSEQPEYYLSVGLNSGIKESDFQRKKLNLVIVMDISGSMGSPFDQYYYDRFGNRMEFADYDKEEGGKTKMEIANKSVVALLSHLNDDDRFGLVLFDDYAYKAKPLTKVGATDMDAIKKHILDLEEQGGTYMEAGMEEGTKMIEEYASADPDQYENRIIFITDAMPNIGDYSDEGLGRILADNADDRIYTSFVGVGVDFNTELVEALTKIKGANYFSVHSSKEFAKVLDEDFEYMVTPLVFDLKLKLDAQGWEIEKVYGSPEADEATGEIMKVNTLFPSKTEGGETKGGLVLIKLRKTEGTVTGGDGGLLTLKVSYEDRNGKKDGEEKMIEFGPSGGPELLIARPGDSDFFANSGIRKGILLSRYADLMKSWATDEARFKDKPVDWPCPPIIVYDYGIRCPEMRCLPPMPPTCPVQLNEWERQSVPLSVSRHYRKVFTDFASYFEEEMNAIGDDTLKQELEVIEELAD
jgi:Ca-activated chloride channel family protein